MMKTRSKRSAFYLTLDGKHIAWVPETEIEIESDGDTITGYIHHLQGRGFSAEQAAALTANLMVESASCQLKPETKREGDYDGPKKGNTC